MVSDKLIEIWKKQGKTEAEIKEKIESLEPIKETPLKMQTNINLKDKKRKKMNFPTKISFRIPEKMGERLDRYCHQQTKIYHGKKGEIYRDIFERFLKFHYKKWGFDWEEDE